MTKALSVLLIDDNPARAEIVEAGLAAAGYRLLARLEGTQDLTVRVRELEIPEQFAKGDFAGDASFRASFSQWLDRLWREKDGQIAQLLPAPR